MSAPDGASRLRGGGVGSILGGLAVGLLGAVVPYVLAAGVVFGAGIAGFAVERHRELDSRISLGVIAIGGIGLLEATGATGLGIEPILLAGFGIAFGVIDILISNLMGRAGSQPE